MHRLCNRILRGALPNDYSIAWGRWVPAKWLQTESGTPLMMTENFNLSVTVVGQFRKDHGEVKIRVGLVWAPMHRAGSSNLWRLGFCNQIQHCLLGKDANNQNGNLRWFSPFFFFFQLSIRRRTPPNDHNFQTFFYPTFFPFAIDSYIDGTDFTLGLSQKYHF